MWLSIILFLFCSIAHADNPPETIYDEGTKQGVAYRLNCVGAGIACTQSGITGTITVSGGGGGGTAAGGLNAVQYNSPVGTFAGDETKFSLNSNGNVGIGTSNGLALFHLNSSAAQDLFRIDDTAGNDATPFIIDQTGNVGIGSANPSAVLAISSTLNQTLFRVDDNGTGDLSPFVIDANGNVGIGTVNTERDKLLVMGGNVGIGTWVPSTALDVAGTIVTTGFRLSTGPVAGGVLVSDTTGIGTWMAASTLPITSSQWATQNTTDVSLAGGNVGVGTTITSNAAFSVMNGNVGIGTWLPRAILEVNGTINLTNNIVQTGASTQLDINPITMVRVGRGTNNSSFALDVYKGDNSATIINHFAGQGDSYMVNTSVGNVGINTTIPKSKLSVGGSVAIGQNYSTITGPNNGLIVESNVGIGTHTPASALQIVGTLTGSNMSMSSGTASSTPYAFTGNSAASANNVFSVSTNSAVGSSFSGSVFGITNSGANSGNGLTVNVSNASALGAGLIVQNAGSGDVLNIRDQASDPSPFIINNSGNVGIMTTQALDSLIVASGNVGIGTLIPSSSLEVGLQKFNVLSGGNVGIGSITPGSNLDIVGTGPRVINANSMGWSVVTGASTACNTTCTFACVVGFDTGTVGVALPHIVGCTDASADECLCAGGS